MSKSTPPNILGVLLRLHCTRAYEPRGAHATTTLDWDKTRWSDVAWMRLRVTSGGDGGFGGSQICIKMGESNLY